jgi:hypothetical protein
MGERRIVADDCATGVMVGRDGARHIEGVEEL